MVSYMWGADVAECLPADPNDLEDFDVSAEDIEKALSDRERRACFSQGFTIPTRSTITFNPVDKSQSTD